MRAATYLYPHELDRALDAHPAIRATLQRLLDDAERDAQQSYEDGVEAGRKDDGSPAAKEAYQRGIDETCDAVSEAFYQLMDDDDADVVDDMAKAVIVERALDKVRDHLRGCPSPDLPSLEAARRTARPHIVELDGRYEVHAWATVAGEPVPIGLSDAHGWRPLSGAKPSRFGDRHKAYCAARKHGSQIY